MMNVKKCGYCRSDMPENTAGNVHCEKCKRNEFKYGKPSTCKFCQLPAAFHEGKCVYCSHSERKFGDPVSCANCKLKAAFSRESKNKNKPGLCRMCINMARDNKHSSLAGVSVPAKDAPSSSNPKEKERRKRRRDEKVDDDSNNSAKKEPPMVDSENVLLLQQMRDQISKLKGTVQDKDVLILQKDKKIAALQADLMSAERKHREKFQVYLKEKEEAIHAVHDKYRQVSKQAKK